MYKTAICGLGAMLAVLGLYGIGPALAQSQELLFGQHRVSASFPCTPKLHKSLAARLESGKEIVLRNLLCTQGDHTYSLGVMEYPPELMKKHTVDELLESYRDNVAAKAHVKIKSSQRMTHQGFPAILYRVLDSRPPVRESVTVQVVVDRSMLMLMVFAKSTSFEPAKHAAFVKSVKVSRQTPAP
jgi:hypothetical protein